MNSLTPVSDEAGKRYAQAGGTGNSEPAGALDWLGTVLLPLIVSLSGKRVHRLGQAGVPIQPGCDGPEGNGAGGHGGAGEQRSFAIVLLGLAASHRGAVSTLCVWFRFHPWMDQSS